MNKNKPIFAKFLNRNGYPYQREDAARVFDTEKEYEIVGGEVFSSVSYFVFRDIPGRWNTVMFNVGWEDARHLMTVY